MAVILNELRVIWIRSHLEKSTQNMRSRRIEMQDKPTHNNHFSTVQVQLVVHDEIMGKLQRWALGTFKVPTITVQILFRKSTDGTILGTF